MASQTDSRELSKDLTTDNYHFVESDDEDEDTYKTHRSIKSSEKML